MIAVLQSGLTGADVWTPILGFVVKSGLIATAGLAAARLVARSPSERADILRVTLGLLLALPLATAVVPALSLNILPMAAATPVSVEPLWSGTAGPVAGVAISGDVFWPSPLAIVAWIWAVGVLLVLGRLALGVWMLGRWTRMAETVRCADWLRSLDRLAPTRRPALLSSDRVRGPLSWGLPPGAILIDRASLAAPEAAPAILAHEMAHVRRHDWAFLMLSRLTLAVFWFNPLVWKVHLDLASTSEDAADAEAVRHVDRHTYARALVGLASSPHPAVALAMAADPKSLKKRISRIMTDAQFRRRPLAVGLTVAALIGVATPLAALELHSRDIALPPLPPAPPALSAPQVPLPPAPPSLPRIPGVPPVPAMAEGLTPLPPLPPMPPMPPMPQAAFAPLAPPAPAAYSSSRYVITENGVTRDATPEERAAADEARAQARDARRVAAEARQEAEAARITARAHARASLAQAEVGRAGAEARRAQAEQGREAARVARAQAARARVDARAQMGNGAVQMRQGADRMRTQAARFDDPAYRARAIEDARRDGNRVPTDAELQAIAPRLRARADELDQRANRLAADAADD